MANTFRKALSRLSRQRDLILGRRPGSVPYLSGDTFRSLARLHWDETPEAPFRAEDIRAGDVIFVSWYLLKFLGEVASRVQVPFILIFSNSDQAFSALEVELLNRTPIVRCYATNVVVDHPKVVPIPLGLENRWYHRHGEVTDFNRLRRKPHPADRLNLCWGFAVQNNVVERTQAKVVLETLPSTTVLQGLDPFQYRRLLRRHHWVASPPGNGPDCHRTWEALYLGVVPIVKRSVMTESFAGKGIPLAQVDSWDELRHWDRSIVGNTQVEALFFSYWKALILGDREEILSGHGPKPSME